MAFGIVCGLIANFEFTTIENDPDAVRGGFAESVICTVKLLVPVAVGVPVIAPVELLSVSPAGKDPFVMLQVTGFTPPVAETVAL